MRAYRRRDSSLRDRRRLGAWWPNGEQTAEWAIRTGRSRRVLEMGHETQRVRHWPPGPKRDWRPEGIFRPWVRRRQTRFLEKAAAPVRPGRVPASDDRRAVRRGRGLPDDSERQCAGAVLRDAEVIRSGVAKVGRSEAESGKWTSPCRSSRAAGFAPERDATVIALHRRQGSGAVFWFCSD